MRKFLLALLLLPVLALHAQVGDPLIPYRQGSKWGYASLDKTIVIPPTFDGAVPFVDGYAIVVRDKQWALIDQNGKEKISFSKDPIFRLSDKTVYILTDAGGGEIDYRAIDTRSGKTVTPICKDIQAKMGMLIAETQNGQGLLDPSGKVIIPIKYDWIDLTPDSLWEVRDGENHALFRFDGEQITDFRYVFVDRYKNNRAEISVGDHFGFLDRKGQEVIPPKYDLLTPLQTAMLWLRKMANLG